MATRNPETRALYTRLQEVLGDEHAATLMTYLPATPDSDLATKDDIAGLEARLDQIDQRWESRFQTVDDRLFGLHGALNDHLKTFTVTMVGGMTALTAIYAALLAFIA